MDRIHPSLEENIAQLLEEAFLEGFEDGVQEGLYLSSGTPSGKSKDPSDRQTTWEQSLACQDARKIMGAPS